MGLSLPLVLIFWRLVKLVWIADYPALVGLVVLGLLLASYFWLREILGLFLLGVIFQSAIGWPREAYEIVQLAIIGSWLAKFMLGRIEINKIRMRLPIPLLLFTAIITANYLISKDYFMTSQSETVIFWLECILLYITMTFSFDSPKAIRNLLIIILSGVAVVSGYGIYQYLAGVNLIPYFQKPGHIMRRVQSVLQDPNALGGYLILFVPLVIAAAYKSKNYIKAIDYLLVVMLVLCLIFTFAFSAWIGLILSLIVGSYILYHSYDYDGKGTKFLLKSAIQHRTFFLLLLLLLLSALLIIGASFVPLILAKAGTFSGRFGFWRTAWRTALVNPLFGVGLGNYSLFVPAGAHSAYHRLPPHNDYLQIASETGFIGLACFMWFTVGSLVKAAKNWSGRSVGDQNLLLRYQWSLWTGVLAFFVYSLAQSPLYFSWQLTIYYFAVLAIINNITLIFQTEYNVETRLISVKDFSVSRILVRVVFLLLVVNVILRLPGLYPEKLQERYDTYRSGTGLTKTGWYKPIMIQPPREDQARILLSTIWMAGSAELAVQNKYAQKGPAIFEAEVMSFLNPKKLVVYLNDRLIEQYQVTTTTRTGRYQKLIIKMDLRPGENKIVLRCQDTLGSPYYYAIDRDRRWLSFNFKRTMRVIILDSRTTYNPLDILLTNPWLNRTS